MLRDKKVRDKYREEEGDNGGRKEKGRERCRRRVGRGVGEEEKEVWGERGDGEEERRGAGGEKERK